MTCPCPAAAGHGRAERDVRPWRDDEIAQALAWRAERPPMVYREIGARLGGRSEQSVRLKLYDERMRAKRGGNNPVGWSHAERERHGPAPIANRDRDLIEACRRTGGFTAFSVQQLRGSQWALCRPIVGGDGRPRPMGWRDGRDPAAMTAAERRYLEELRRWWRAGDRRARG